MTPDGSISTIELPGRRTGTATACGWLALTQVGIIARLVAVTENPWSSALIVIPMATAGVMLGWRAINGQPDRAAPRYETVFALTLAGMLAGWQCPTWMLGPAWALLLIAAVWTILGRCVARAVLLPCLGMALVGMGEALSQTFVSLAQQASASIVATMLGWFGVDITSRGAWLVWTTGRVEVSPECAGVNSWQASLVWAWFLVCIGRMKPRRVILFLVAAAGLTVVSNLTRIAILVELVRWQGYSILESRWHSLVGLGTFACGFGVLILLWMRWQPNTAIVSTAAQTVAYRSLEVR